MASSFAFSGSYACTVGIPISMGMMASIPYMRVNGDMPVGFRLVVLLAHKTPSSSSTHFPLVECRHFSELIG